MALTKISTDGVKDDAVTAGKIPANAVGSSELADNAVDTNAIQDQAVALSKLPHGDSNNNGKFLRANNGADPSFETVSIPAGTTINNNADNRVITGSGTANTLNGESALTFDGNKLTVNGGATARTIDVKTTHGSGGEIASFQNTTAGAYGGLIVSGGENNYECRLETAYGSSFMTLYTNNNERFRIDSSGHVGIGVTPDNTFSFGKALDIGSSTGSFVYVRDTDQAAAVGGIGYSGTDLYISNKAAGNIRFLCNTDATERMRIDSSGRVGIQGTPDSSNFGAKLQVRESGQAATTLTALFGANENASGTTGGISDNTNKACRIGLPHYDTDQKAANMFVGYAGSGVNELYIGGGTGLMNGMTSVRIYADSSSTVNNGGNQVARFDSDGLKFGSDTAAANALDDYEEGTWTPNSSQGMGTVYHASYTKIGRVVHVNFYVNAPSSTNTGAFVINNLPFTVAGSAHYPVGSCYTQLTSTTYVFLQGNQNSTTLNVLKTVGHGVTFADLNSGYVLGSLTYITS